MLFEVLFETALGMKGLEGAATAQEAEAKAQTVAEVKRILRLMIQYGKKKKTWESTSYVYYLPIFLTAFCKRRMHHMRPSISATQFLRRTESGPVLEGLAPVSTSLAARLAGIG